MVQLPRAKCSNILGYSVPKTVITKLGCVHETQLKPVGHGLGPTESVGRNAWYAWYAGTLVSDKTPEIKSAKFTDEII